MPTNDAASRSWDQMVVVGRVARAHGNKGAVIVNLETDFPELRFQPGNVLYTCVGDSIRELIITTARFQRGRPVLALDGVETMNDAEALAGIELRIPEAELVDLPADSFYHHQLVGCVVRTEDGAVIGTVTGVEGVSGAYRLSVECADDSGAQVDVPLVDSICTRVNPEQGEITVDLPEGLLELNRRH